MTVRFAYMPLSTYPELVADSAILAAVGFAATLGCKLYVTTFSVDIPQMYSPFGSLVLDVPGLVRTAEDKSKAECRRLQELVQGPGGARAHVQVTTRQVVLGVALEAAAAEARYYDLSVLPWSGETVSAQDYSEAVVFGSGRPAILVPTSTPAATIDHIAIAWDGSRVAARALGDALSLLPRGGLVTVLTVKDEKPLSGSDPARVLAASLEKRGFNAKALDVRMGEGTIAEALQETAKAEGAKLMVMGGFGHSRVRDFVLGGATKGVLSDLRLPVLLSH